MAEPNSGRGRGYALNKWLKENTIKRRTVGGEGICKDEIIEEMGKVVKRSTGTQWEERPVCVVRPNMRTGGARGVISFLYCNCNCQWQDIEVWYC